MSEKMVVYIAEAIHCALASPRTNKWVPLTGFGMDYQRGMQAQARAAIAAVRKWDIEQGSDGQGEV